jgi:hypothetical protein
MSKSAAKEPMPVKYWSFAGIMLTYWCNARCACCYLCCSNKHLHYTLPEQALEVWRQLVQASPHGCRVHLTGGEPFGNWELLIEICRRARQEGLGPLEKVETNAFWAVDETLVRERLVALDQAGMETLAISADPYHQQFVPIQRCRMLAAMAKEVLGEDRVQVRWRDWLADGFDTDGLDDAARGELFAKYGATGRERLCGRAAQLLAKELPVKAPCEFSDINCRESLLRGRHVHIDPSGLVMPGTCAGIVLGQMGPDRSAGELWQSLHDLATRPVVAVLAAKGPVGLMQQAIAQGFAPDHGYASKCHLCWHVRQFMSRKNMAPNELGPSWLYEDQVGE